MVYSTSAYCKYTDLSAWQQIPLSFYYSIPNDAHIMICCMGVILKSYIIHLPLSVLISKEYRASPEAEHESENTFSELATITGDFLLHLRNIRAIINHGCQEAREKRKMNSFFWKLGSLEGRLHCKAVP